MANKAKKEEEQEEGEKKKKRRVKKMELADLSHRTLSEFLPLPFRPLWICSSVYFLLSSYGLWWQHRGWYGEESGLVLWFLPSFVAGVGFLGKKVVFWKSKFNQNQRPQYFQKLANGLYLCAPSFSGVIEGKGAKKVRKWEDGCWVSCGWCWASDFLSLCSREVIKCVFLLKTYFKTPVGKMLHVILRCCNTFWASF